MKQKVSTKLDNIQEIHETKNWWNHRLGAALIKIKPIKKSLAPLVGKIYKV